MRIYYQKTTPKQAAIIKGIKAIDAYLVGESTQSLKKLKNCQLKI